MVSLFAGYINGPLAQNFIIKLSSLFRIKQFKAFQSKPAINSARSLLMGVSKKEGRAR